MATTIPPPPRMVPEFNEVWKDWLWYMWKQTKGGEEGQTGGGDENAIHSNRDSEISALTEKTTPADADVFIIEDSATSHTKKKVSLANTRKVVRFDTIVSKTTAYSVLTADDIILCDTSAGAFTVTLPSTPETGRGYTVTLEVAGNTLTIDGNGNNINGSATIFTNVAGTSLTMVYNGTQWNIK